MAPTPAVYVSYTGEVNPPGITPILTHGQVWAGLAMKVEHAQDFLPGVITTTDVIAHEHDEHGRPVTVREIVFKEGNRRVKEVVTMFEPTKILFVLPNGSRVQNIISAGATGDLFVTYDFEWLHDSMSEADLAKQKDKYAQMSKSAVESSITAIREFVKSGRIQV